MIVKNEAQMLPGCLESVRGLVGEIIVVDTGSTDCTARIAAAAGARIINHEWNDDFAEARNVSIRPATGDWILWLDADERLPAKEHHRVRKAVRSARIDAYNVPIHNRDDKSGYTSRGHRLFRNRIGIEFSGIVHEQISPSFKRARARTANADFTIEHLGYGLGPEAMARKNERNLRLLTRAKAKDPRDAYIRFTLGQAYLLMNDKHAAQKEIIVALGENPAEPVRKPLPPDIRASAHTNLAECALARGAYADALKRCRKSLQIRPHQTTAHLMAYQVYTAMGDAAHALRELTCVEHMSKKASESGASAVEVMIDRNTLWRTMGQLHLKMGHFEQAQDCFTRILQDEPDNAEALYGAGTCALAQGRLDEALTRARQARRLNPEDPPTNELLSLVLLKQLRFDEAAQCMAGMLRRHPHDNTLRKRLAGVLVKAGRSEEARRVLSGAEPEYMCAADGAVSI